MVFTYSVLYAEGLIMAAILAQRLQTAKNTLVAGQRSKYNRYILLNSELSTIHGLIQIICQKYQSIT